MQDELIAKVSDLESSIGRKVDRHQWEHLEVLASKLSTYAEFKTNTVSKFDELQRELSQMRGQHDRLTEELQSCHNEVQRQKNEVTKLASRNELRLVAKELEKVVNQMEQTATKSSLGQVGSSPCLTGRTDLMM